MFYKWEMAEQRSQLPQNKEFQLQARTKQFECLIYTLMSHIYD